MKKNLIIAVLAALLVSEVRATLKNRVIIRNLNEKNDRIIMRDRKIVDRSVAVAELANFYATKLNQHQVPLDEFEHIIMHDLESKI